MLAGVNPHALRASALIIFTPLFSATGISFIAARLRSQPARACVSALMIVVCMVSGVRLIARCFVDPTLENPNQQNRLVLMSQMLGDISSGYDEVLIEDSGNQPYLYVISFGGMTPVEFMQAEKDYSSGDWYHFSRVGKYRFLPRSIIESMLSSPYATDHKILAVSQEGIPGAVFLGEAGGFYFMRAEPQGL